ncbi:hypothetical protein BQ8420_08600 [Nocardiopsis sp. JB363]|nr:hypothetical protein BQ8420_08600 [Nocardiopsis sp. JB363]
MAATRTPAPVAAQRNTDLTVEASFSLARTSQDQWTKSRTVAVKGP